MSTPFEEQLLEYHRIILNGSCEEFTDDFREKLAYLISAMTNLNSDAKQEVFNDLVSCYPKLNYNEIAKHI